MRRRVALALSAGLLGLGVFGAWSYVHNYIVYRGFPPPHDPAGVPTGTLQRVAFQSKALGRRDSYLIYLPHGYAQAAARGARFPVLYLLHGTYSEAMHYIDVGKVGVDLDTLLAKHRARPFLVVMPESSDGSIHDDMEWANTPDGRFESAVLDIVRNVDSHFSTVHNRTGRAIGGLSMGGYGALNITFRHPRIFATVESWSGYFTQSRSGPFASASQAALRLNSPALYAQKVGKRLRRLQFHVLLYGGKGDPLTRQQAPFAHELQGLGMHVRSLRPIGKHNWKLWRDEMPVALRYASRWLTARGSPRGRSGAPSRSGPPSRSRPPSRSGAPSVIRVWTGASHHAATPTAKKART
jgi:enterochelin esterase-like enzyme